MACVATTGLSLYFSPTFSSNHSWLPVHWLSSGSSNLSGGLPPVNFCMCCLVVWNFSLPTSHLVNSTHFSCLNTNIPHPVKPLISLLYAILDTFFMSTHHHLQLLYLLSMYCLVSEYPIRHCAPVITPAKSICPAWSGYSKHMLKETICQTEGQLQETKFWVQTTLLISRRGSARASRTSLTQVFDTKYFRRLAFSLQKLSLLQWSSNTFDVSPRNKLQMVPNQWFQTVPWGALGLCRNVSGSQEEGHPEDSRLRVGTGFHFFCSQHCSSFNSFYILGSPKASFQKWHLILKEQNNKKAL